MCLESVLRGRGFRTSSAIPVKIWTRQELENKRASASLAEHRHTAGHAGKPATAR